MCECVRARRERGARGFSLGQLHQQHNNYTMMTDRQMKLASYHARKVAERQQLQQQQSSSTKPMAGGDEYERSSSAKSTAAAAAESSTLQPATVHTIQATTAIPSIKNANNIDNGASRDAMKQLFATRRRRALAEMMIMQSHPTTTISISTSSAAKTTLNLSIPSTATAAATATPKNTSGGDGGGATVARSSGGGGGTEEFSVVGAGEKGDGGENNTKGRRTMKDGESSCSSKISSSNAASTITSSSTMMITSRSRRALDRYLGKEGGGGGGGKCLGSSNGKREMGRASSGGGAYYAGGTSVEESIASKNSRGSNTTTSSISSSIRDLKDGHDNALIAKAAADGGRGNALIPPSTSTTTTTAAITTRTVMEGGTRDNVSNTASTTNPTNAVTKEVAKSVRFKLSPRRRLTNDDGDDYVLEKPCYHSELNKKERPYCYDEERAYHDEKDGWSKRELDDKKKEKHDETRMIKTQCSPPRSTTIQSLGISDGGGKGNVTSSSGHDEDRVWVNGATTELEVEEEEEEEEEEVVVDTDFVMFVEGLRRELAGDHTEVRKMVAPPLHFCYPYFISLNTLDTLPISILFLSQLWAGFQALLGRSPGEQVPLYNMMSSHDDDKLQQLHPQHHDDGGDNSKQNTVKKKKIKMDPRTQNSLTAIHRHLMEDSRVKSKFMTTSSQLVNDKKVRKGRVKNERSGGDGTIFDDRGAAGSLKTDHSVTYCARYQQRNDESANGFDSLANSVPEDHSTQCSSNKVGNGCGPRQEQQYRAEQEQKQHGDKRESWLQSYKDKKSAHLAGKSKLRITTFPSPRSKNGDNSCGPIKHTRRNSSTSHVEWNDERNIGGTSAANDPKRRLSWMEALKAKQKTLRSKQSANSDDTIGSTFQTSQEEAGSSSSLSTPRMISPRKKSHPSPPSTPKGAPWLNVQLRSTPKTRSSMAPAAEPTSTCISYATPTSLANKFFVPSASNTSNSLSSESSAPSTLPALCCVGDVIDLDALPPNVFPTHEGEATILPLKQSAIDPSKGRGEIEKVVVVGRTVIATANIIPSSTSDAPRKASITWWCRRSEIRTLTLNVEATGANLAHVHGRTPLLFNSPDVCLDFAQSFYRGSTTKPGESMTTVLASNEKGKNDECVTNGAATNLTNDEESLLDRYRQYSQSERTKLRLMCLSPQGEVQEVEVDLSPASKLLQSRKVADQDSRAKPTLEAAATSSVNNTEGKSSLSMEEEERASKYRKMLKMGIPPDAVRHKMISDDIQPTIMSAVLDDSTAMNRASESTKKANATECSELTGEEEVLAEKYRKMLRMGVPLDGVKHKMAQESVDLKIVSVLVREASPSSASAEVKSDNSHQVEMSAKIDVSLLSNEEEAIATAYRSMLKVCIPKEAVRHKMKQDGIISKIVEAVLGKDSTKIAGSDSTSFQTNTTNRKTIAFHWTTSNLAPELLEQSIFGRTELKKRKLALVNPEEADIKKLEEIFQKRNNSNTGKIKANSQDEGGNDMAKLLDLTRANNIAISLKSFNDFTFRSLAETIGDLDPDHKIVGERVQFLPNLLPTPKEIQAIKTYKGDEDKLITAELFFRQLVSVKRIEDKVKAMQAMATFEERVEEARAGQKTLQEVCSQVMNSEKLIQVLEMVLNIGNLMNAGTLHGGVEAFKFESLSKLSETKSADGKTTVLDYIIETFIEKGERKALFLMSEFPSIQVREYPP